MKCQRCKEREANVKIMKQMTGKAPQMLMLCDECARQLGITMPGSLTGGLFGNALGGGIPNPLGSSMSSPLDILASAFEAPFGLGLEGFMDQGEALTCPTCGTNLRQFTKSGFLGCPDCYETFSERIDPVFMRTQMGMKHVGRIPAKKSEEEDPSGKESDVKLHQVDTDPFAGLSEEEKEKKKTILEKEALLKKAVQEENYLEAAKLRDEIQALKNSEEGKK